MTDQTQSAVEVMAKARWNATHVTRWDTLSAGVQKDFIKDEQVSLTALLAHLAHLAASGWQIVPVVASQPMKNAAIDVYPYELGDLSPIGLRCSPQRMFEKCYAAMLAAAPQFPGSEG